MVDFRRCEHALIVVKSTIAAILFYVCSMIDFLLFFYNFLYKVLLNECPVPPHRPVPA